MPWTPDFDKTDIEEGYEIQRKSLLKGHLVFKYSFGSSTERILYWLQAKDTHNITLLIL